MKLLGAIYDSPVKLLEKAERDGAALTQALSNCDESAVHDSLFNFAITAYHLVDWVKTLRPEVDISKVSDLLEGSECLRACRDLCNASKHIDLTKYPPTAQDVRFSATAATSISNTSASQPPWRLKIQMKDGHTIRADDLVSDVIDAWKTFFADNHIQ
ncbi:hypothetical protein [Paraburkholderia sp. Cpub6]|uniref:hypothetical protein n=1 Tax=Paraburkholderia sp. Cpub6 TaxID=2723094 RepID=UPI00162311A8|nr:hypothetical protein [Paraburkholderia sp. Cpub6]MBB5459013.1 hypothetical protein [Paraburkholderia sp. Cpub6]